MQQQIKSSLPLDVDDWDNEAYKYRLKIGDMVNLQKGDKLEFLVLDRNVYDKEEEVGDYDPKTFFGYNKATYVHDKDLTGKLTLFCDHDPIELNNFEFHIEYKPLSWYPLNNGKLPKKDPQGFSTFNYAKPKSWTEFSMDTGIGYRGPILLWSKLDNLPKIRWDE